MIFGYCKFNFNFQGGGIKGAGIMFEKASLLMSTYKKNFQIVASQRFLQHSFMHVCRQSRDKSFCLPKIFINNTQAFNTVTFIMSFADIVTTEVPPLSWVDNNLTMEKHEECGEEVCKPNPAEIPTGKMFNFYAHST